MSKGSPRNAWPSSLYWGSAGTPRDFCSGACTDSLGPSDHDRATAALTERVALGTKSAILQVSPVEHFEDYGPNVDVLRTWVVWDDGTLLALRDIYSKVSREEAYRLWSLLCDQITLAAAMPYGLRVEPGTNPKLGCWGPRPELLNQGVDDDSATALMIGIAIDTQLALQRPNPKLVVLAVRSAVVAALRTWIGAAPDPAPRISAN
ncbi:MAG: hypothetical protein EXR58_01695 [Chloroflexi bacterium]|nr:hypothetical protein [Chloroflexota bacterium]